MNKSMLIPAILVSGALLVGAAPVYAAAMTGHPQSRHAPTVVKHPAKSKPAPKAEKKPTAPSEITVWVPGDYFWDGQDWIWADGYWLDQPWDDAVWVPGHWVERPWGWLWIDGYWY